MLTALISDLHANFEAVQSVFSRIDTFGVDQVLCLGDVVGYGPEPNEVVELVREHEAIVIQGNHDAAASGREEACFFQAQARRAIAWQRACLTEDNKRWLASLPPEHTFEEFCLGVHGSPTCRDAYIDNWVEALGHFQSMNGCKACFFGHTHCAALFSERGESILAPREFSVQLSENNRYLINPGAVGQPRDGDPRAAFGLLDSERLTFEFIRVDYDIARCAKKIRAAGLPEPLAKRLAKGK